MASYNIFVKPSVETDLLVLSRAAIARVLKRIDELKHDPIPRQSVKLTGAERLYRTRTGDYRIIYEVDTEASLIVIHHVRHRREAYRDL